MQGWTHETPATPPRGGRRRPGRPGGGRGAWLLAGIVAGAAWIGVAASVPAATGSQGGSSVLDRTMTRIDGREQDLAEFKGQVVLVVNVASKCGLTPQYDGLESLYRRYRDRGFVVLGFPANDFAGQEPGSNAEIAEFCRSKYGVDFPMFEKITVKGDDMHPLYRDLTSQPPPVGGEVQWNFQKYLVDREGRVVAKFSPRVHPEDPALVGKLEELL